MLDARSGSTADWALLLGGFLVWTVHFFALYFIASIFPETLLARLLVAAVTLACLGADAVLLRWAVRDLRRLDEGDFRHWLRRVAALAALLSLVAVFWQGLPALLV